VGAEFYVEPYGWIPVDASEAWKHPDKKDYFFGAHDDNRLQFTVGRDIRLDPPQQAIRSTTSSILTRWTESRSRWNPSSRSKTESTVATEALSALLAMPGRSASSQMCAAHRSRDDYP